VTHPKVPHPRRFLDAERKWNDVAANMVARIFGSPWCIWVFLIVPLVILLAPQQWQGAVFYLASGWVQLFALPLLTYVGNKARAADSVKADVDHEALTHIAKTVDALVAALAELRAEVTALKAPRPPRVAKKPTP
jgi:hypothetical protein